MANPGSSLPGDVAALSQPCHAASRLSVHLPLSVRSMPYVMPSTCKPRRHLFSFLAHLKHLLHQRTVKPPEGLVHALISVSLCASLPFSL